MAFWDDIDWGDTARVVAGVMTLGETEVLNEVTGGKLWGEDSTYTGLADTLWGEDEPAVPDTHIALDESLGKVTEEGRATQLAGLGLQKENIERLRKMDPAKQARAQQVLNEKNIIGAGADSKRRAQQLTAQRGLGRSSVGLNAMLNADRQTAKDIGASRAGAPLREQQLYQQRAQAGAQSMSTANQALNARGAERAMKMGSEGGRGGGLGNMLLTTGGAIVGGYFGGPAGAQAGAQIGTGLGGYAQSSF